MHIILTTIIWLEQRLEWNLGQQEHFYTEINNSFYKFFNKHFIQPSGNRAHKIFTANFKKCTPLQIYNSHGAPPHN